MPLDLNDDRFANTIDILFFKGKVPAILGSAIYNKRLDFNADGAQNVIDILFFKGKTPSACS